jgi:hypothetical protein
VNSFFLRGNLAGQFGDLGAPVAILAAWLMATPSGVKKTARVLTWAVTVAVLVATTLAVDTIGSVTHELDTTGLSDSMKKIGRRIGTVTTELAALPPPPRGDAAGIPNPNLADYLRACTRPDDRVLVMANAPEIYAMAARSFAAGQPTFRPGYFDSIEEQQLMLKRLRTQSVPVVVTEPEEIYEGQLASSFPLLRDYIASVYEPAGELPGFASVLMHVLVRRERTATHTFGETGLPCFE